jgi:hypothetical protein
LLAASGIFDTMVDAIVIAMVVIAAGILWFTRRRAPKAKTATVNYLIPGEDARQTSPSSKPVDDGLRAFEPDGVYSGIPFKVRDGGQIEAMLADGPVVFLDFNQFIEFVKAKSILHSD